VPDLDADPDGDTRDTGGIYTNADARH